jgi:hypothetical protein
VSPLKGFSTKLAASASFSSCRAASRFSTVIVPVNEDRIRKCSYIFFYGSVRRIGTDRLISETKTDFDRCTDMHGDTNFETMKNITLYLLPECVSRVSRS